jgi:glutaminyl-peptide cyclotransferase
MQAWLPLLLLLAQFARAPEPARYGYRVVKKYPHDAGAFTQGLEYKDGMLYEGTGLNGRSSLRKVRLETGEVVQRQPLAEAYFGEGITVQSARVLQLTWKHGEGFIYDRKTLRRTGSFKYPGEGWGLASDAAHVYMSDGSAQIRVWDAATLKEVRRLTVTNGGRAVDQINELEVVEGEIFANVWYSDVILRISPKDGRVAGVVDLRGLSSEARSESPAADVLNGIAYDAARKRLFVTGKLWPKLYEIELEKR